MKKTTNLSQLKPGMRIRLQAPAYSNWLTREGTVISNNGRIVDVKFDDFSRHELDDGDVEAYVYHEEELTNADRQALSRWRRAVAYDALKAAAANIGIDIDNRNTTDFDTLLKAIEAGQKKVVLVD